MPPDAGRSKMLTGIGGFVLGFVFLALGLGFYHMTKAECHFTNGTEKVRYLLRHIYNREQLAMFDSDVGHYVGFTPRGEKCARDWNSKPELMEHRWTAVDWFCRFWYKTYTPFITERRGERGAERVPSGSALPITLEPLKTSLGIAPELSALLVPISGTFWPGR
ncbi:class II histocompatibility antigen, B-L beta chain-like [Pyrgilauda ruficollis]|uniref:class II histocompatibility antigen, B-L beta chain-like n=1 Tax=Pyrgilauda ruficollis TaxID=221976 RepID=UPI001B886763|nr:class II histocompatibility antigen, B-L beta chain-like [Pyrgilauda ruficollis]